MSYIKVSAMFLKKIISAAALMLVVVNMAYAQLDPEQQAAKERGITLFNQYKPAYSDLLIAAEAGDSEAQYYLAEDIRLEHRYVTKEAAKWYIAAANQGDYYAMFRLSDTDSDLCKIMNNCPKGSKSAADWTRLLWKTAEPLAKAGDGEAMMIMYNSTGEMEWLKKSAEAGYARAQLSLANRYLEGEGFFLPWNRSAAVKKWLKASSEGGNPKGMMQYADTLYNDGHAKGKDIEEVRHWMAEASKLGYVSAISSYGAYLAHEPDAIGYPLDRVKGYGLLSLLRVLDGGGNIQVYLDDVMPEIAAKMTPEELEQAKVFAEEWEKAHPPVSFFPDKLGF
ncbi:tetratricopeptide repeat protein [Pseudomonas sp.]|uniref:tetratricopeptide repeat protein n=1 Tax=Pseudomonas sp. TaxID=306 RepID=UPI003A986E0B